MPRTVKEIALEAVGAMAEKRLDRLVGMWGDAIFELSRADPKLTDKELFEHVVCQLYASRAYMIACPGHASGHMLNESARSYFACRQLAGLEAT